MKAIIAALLWLSAGVQAVEVTATGFGRSADESLANAKTAALERVAGTFVVGESDTDGKRYRERIAQYHGGYIRRHEVLSVVERSGLIETTIQADIDDEKFNAVLQSQGSDLPGDLAEQITRAQDDRARTQAMLATIDDPTRAFAVQVQRISIANRGEMSDFMVEARIVFSPKWVDDVRTLARAIGRPVDTGSAWQEALWGLAALTAVVNPALPGHLFSVARHTRKPPKSTQQYMACFSRTNQWDVDECFEILHPLLRTTGDKGLRLRGTVWLGDEARPLEPFRVDCQHQLFITVQDGQKLYFRSSARERRFSNPGVLLFERGIMPFSYSFTAPTSIVKRMTRIELAPA